MLRRMLNSHPSMRCHGELFPAIGHPANAHLKNFSRNGTHFDEPQLLSVRNSDPQRFLEGYVLYPGNDLAVGAKIKYDELGGHNPNPVAQKANAMNDIRIVHLRRNNRLRRLLSHKLAVKTGVTLIRSESD